jgi:aspartate kinase
LSIIVQKFGGTSVATKEGRDKIADRVSSAICLGYSPVVVVSAMGRAGDPYSTDTLISLAKNTFTNTGPRELDLIMSCGETISSVVITGTLKSRSIEAFPMTGGQAGIITDDSFGDAHVLKVKADLVMSVLSQGKVPVVTGFQGVTDLGDTTTLGRGGSDTSAVLLGAALAAEAVEIYTDVDGIKTADPRLVPNARTIRHLTYDEVSQMAYEGAKVINPKAIDIAMKHNLPIWVRSTFDDSKGTLVTREVGQLIWSEMGDVRPVTGVTHRPALCQFSVQTTEDVSASKIFRRLADEKISVDMIFVTPRKCSFVVRDDLAMNAKASLNSMNLASTMTRDCAKVTVVGLGMRGVPRVMADVSEALKEEKIEILQTADSHVTISCLVRGEDLERAVKALHEKFELGSQKSVKEDYL